MLLWEIVQRNQGHQRGCKIVRNVTATAIDGNYCESAECLDDYLDEIYDEYFWAKPEILLPRADNDRQLANTYFQTAFVHVTVDESNVNAIVKMMKEIVYNY